MTANHLVVNFADDVVDGEAALFGGNLRVEKDLEEEIAKFFGEFGVVVRIEGVEDFVGFLNEVGTQGIVGLFAVPGAAARSAEAGHDRGKPGEGGAGVFVQRGFSGDARFVSLAREFARRHARVFLRIYCTRRRWWSQLSGKSGSGSV